MAVTRARRQLMVVCDSQTVRNHDFLRSLVDYMSEHGEVRTAFEYLEDLVPENYSRGSKDEQAASKVSSSTKPKARNHQGKREESKHKKEFENKGKEEGQSKAPADFKHSNHTKSNYAKSKADDLTETQINKEELRQQLLVFLGDKNQMEFQFPSSLNSHERLVVHQLSEELGLKHVSQGVGKQRRIAVSKLDPGPEEQVWEPAEKPSEESVGNPAEKMESTQPEIQIPGKLIEKEPNREPQKPALDLKSLHLERIRREQEKWEEKSKKLETDLKGSKDQATKKNKGASKGL